VTDPAAELKVLQCFSYETLKLTHI